MLIFHVRLSFLLPNLLLYRLCVLYFFLWFIPTWSRFEKCREQIIIKSKLCLKMLEVIGLSVGIQKIYIRAGSIHRLHAVWKSTTFLIHCICVPSSLKLAFTHCSGSFPKQAVYLARTNTTPNNTKVRNKRFFGHKVYEEEWNTEWVSKQQNETKTKRHIFSLIIFFLFFIFIFVSLACFGSSFFCCFHSQQHALCPRPTPELAL